MSRRHSPEVAATPAAFCPCRGGHWPSAVKARDHKTPMQIRTPVSRYVFASPGSFLQISPRTSDARPYTVYCRWYVSRRRGGHWPSGSSVRRHLPQANPMHRAWTDRLLTHPMHASHARASDARPYTVYCREYVSRRRGGHWPSAVKASDPTSPMQIRTPFSRSVFASPGSFLLISPRASDARPYTVNRPYCSKSAAFRSAKLFLSDSLRRSGPLTS